MWWQVDTHVTVEVLLAGEHDAGQEDTLEGRESSGVSSKYGHRGDSQGFVVSGEHLRGSSVDCPGELGEDNHQS